MNLDSGFSCTRLVQVSWQRGSVTVIQGWAEGDPGVKLQWVCLGTGQGGGGRDTGVECIKCWCQPQAWAQTMDNASPLCLSH